MRVKLQEVFNEEKCRHIDWLERMYCIQFLSHNIGESMFLLIVLIIL